MSSIDDWAATPASGPTIDQWSGETPTAAPANPAYGVTPAAGAQLPVATPSGFFPQLGRQLGLGARMVGNGVADALGTVVDPFDRLIGAQPASGLVRNAVNANTPQPQGGLEQGVQTVGSAIANPLNLVGGEVVAPGSTAIGRMAGVLPRAVSPGIGRTALSGAVTAGIQPTTPDESGADYAGSMLGGGLGGAGIGGLTGLAGRLIAPAVDPAVQRLMARGVTPTPGMIAGGAANRAEQALTSMPFAGGYLAGARGRAIDSFNVAAYNDALAPLGMTVPNGTTAGGAGVQAVHDAVSGAYDDLAQNAKFNYDYPLHADIQGIRADLAQRVPPDVQDQFNSIVQNQIMGKMDPNTGEMTGQQWNGSRSMLNTLERNNRIGQPNNNEVSLANAIGQLNDAMDANVVRNSPAGTQDALSAAGNAYARYKRVEQAAGYTGARNSGNVFTPADYSRAIGAGSTALQKGTGTGLNAGFAGDAQALANKVPNSGTPERAGMIGAILALPHLIAHPELVAGIPAAKAAYSPMGVNAIGNLMTSRPAALQRAGQAIRGLAVPGAVAGGMLGAQLPTAVDSQDSIVTP